MKHLTGPNIVIIGVGSLLGEVCTTKQLFSYSQLVGKTVVELETDQPLRIHFDLRQQVGQRCGLVAGEN